jgi:hypothetical protein
LRFLTPLITTCVALAASPWDEARATEPPAPVRGIFIRPECATREFLASWKAKGATVIVVALDDSTKRSWRTIAEAVEREGMSLWPWVEVARNPAMADAHPDWMAAPGGHHDDWRRRFPKAPVAESGKAIKAWPWVPIGYAPAFEAHRARLKVLLGDLPGAWAGVFLNDLQAGPSSCGCGNDQCRWALDYGLPSTAPKTPGDDAAARMVAELLARHPGKAVVPVWVTECELVDLPDAKGGTGLCGRVSCAKADCWPRYARAWNPLLGVTDGPVAVAIWPETFQRDPAHWIEADLALFRNAPRGSKPLAAARAIAVVQAWQKTEPAIDAMLGELGRLGSGWVLALDPIDQSWEPRLVPIRP